MKIEYDPERDLLYLYFADPGKKQRKQSPSSPGVLQTLTAMANSSV